LVPWVVATADARAPMRRVEKVQEVLGIARVVLGEPDPRVLQRRVGTDVPPRRRELVDGEARAAGHRLRPVVYGAVRRGPDQADFAVTDPEALPRLERQRTEPHGVERRQGP